MEGLAQVNLIVTDLGRAKEFWALLGWQSTPRHPNAALVTFPNGMNLVLHEPEFARLWDPAYAGPAAGSTVVDLNLSSRQAVDATYARVVEAGHPSSVEPWDTFFGARGRDSRATSRGTTISDPSSPADRHSCTRCVAPPGHDRLVVASAEWPTTQRSARLCSTPMSLARR